jgi:predicted MFS family arabinose efflux permease
MQTVQPSRPAASLRGEAGQAPASATDAAGPAAAADSPDRFSALEWRASISLSTLYGLRMLGLFIILPVFAVYAQHMPGGNSPALVGLAIGIYGLTQALLQIPFGWASDRFGRKRVMYFGLLLFAFGSFVAAIAPDLYVVVLGRFLQGAGAISAVVIALTADLTRESQRSKAMAIIGSTIGLAFAVSLIAGPPLNAAIGVAGIFTLTGILALAAILVVHSLVPEPPPDVAASRVSRASFRDDLRAVLADRELMRLNYGVLVLHALLTALFLVVPVALRDAGLAVADHWHVYWPAMLVSFAVMVPAIGYAERRRKVKAALVVSIAITALSVAMLGASLHSVLWIGVALAVFFIGFNLLEALLPSLVSRTASARLRGTAIGLYSSIQFIGIFLGGAIGGILVQFGGLGSVLVVGGALVVIWLGVALGMRPVRASAPAAAGTGVAPTIQQSNA